MMPAFTSASSRDRGLGVELLGIDRRLDAADD
jgi:hypothetical protein